MAKFTFLDIYDFGGHIALVETDSSSPAVYYASKFGVFIIFLGLSYIFGPIIFMLLYTNNILGYEHTNKKTLDSDTIDKIKDGYEINLLTIGLSLGYLYNYIYGGLGLFTSLSFLGYEYNNINTQEFLFNINIILGLYSLVLLFFSQYIFDTFTTYGSRFTHIILLISFIIISLYISTYGEILPVTMYDGYSDILLRNEEGILYHLVNFIKAFLNLFI